MSRSSPSLCHLSTPIEDPPPPLREYKDDERTAIVDNRQKI